MVIFNFISNKKSLVVALFWHLLKSCSYCENTDVIYVVDIVISMVINTMIFPIIVLLNFLIKLKTEEVIHGDLVYKMVNYLIFYIGHFDVWSSSIKMFLNMGMNTCVTTLLQTYLSRANLQKIKGSDFVFIIMYVVLVMT